MRRTAALADGAVTLSGALCHGDLEGPATATAPLQTTIPRGRPTRDSRLGLFPLHSPLLGES